MSTPTDTLMANRILKILGRRKGWDSFFNAWDSESRASLKREIGREIRKIAKELNAHKENES